MSHKVRELRKIYFALSNKKNSYEINKFVNKASNHIIKLSRDIPPADFADLIILKNPNFQARLFKILEKERRAQVFAHLNNHDQNELIKFLSPVEIKELLSEMEPDDRATFFQESSSVATRKLLNLLDKESASELANILGYPENSIGRFMTTDYIAIRPDWNLAQALEHVRKWGEKSETSNVLYVTDKEWKLLGVVSLRNIVINSLTTQVEEIMKTPAICVKALDDQEEASKIMQKYDLSVLPVIDPFERLVGIITADDIFDVVEEETTEDFQKSSAVESFTENFLHLNIFFLFRKRIGWLVILTFINLISGSILLSFGDLLSQVVVLVSFIPLLIGSAGNSGSQSATLAIRAMAVGDVKMSDWLLVIGREVVIALLLGVTMGVIAGTIGYFRGDIAIGFIVAITMIIVVLFGSLIGVSLPFILNKLKIDPAIASSPLVTSIADVLGVLVYLVVAKSLLGL